MMSIVQKLARLFCLCLFTASTFAVAIAGPSALRRDSYKYDPSLHATARQAAVNRLDEKTVSFADYKKLLTVAEHDPNEDVRKSAKRMSDLALITSNPKIAYDCANDAFDRKSVFERLNYTTLVDADIATLEKIIAFDPDTMVKQTINDLIVRHRDYQKLLAIQKNRNIPYQFEELVVRRENAIRGLDITKLGQPDLATLKLIVELDKAEAVRVITKAVISRYYLWKISKE